MEVFVDSTVLTGWKTEPQPTDTDGADLTQWLCWDVGEVGVGSLIDIAVDWDVPSTWSDVLHEML